jgi:hypothetical protein
MGSEARFHIYNGVIAGVPTFYPGFIKANGEFVSPHLVTPVYINHDNGGYNNPDPNAKRKASSLLELTIWGDKACAVGAHWFTPGKKMNFRGRMESKKLPVKNNVGEVVLQIASGVEVDPASGQKFQQGTQIPIYRWRNSFIIEKFHFGEDSAEANRQKPQGWNVEGTQGYQAWQQFIAGKKASQAAGYQGGDTFGIAKVGKVNGQLARKDEQGNVVALGNAVAPQGQFVQPQQFAQPNNGQFVQPGMVPNGGVMPNTPPNMGMPQTFVPPQGGFVPNQPMQAAGNQYAGM